MIETRQRSILDVWDVVCIPCVCQYVHTRMGYAWMWIFMVADYELVCLVKWISSNLDWKPGVVRPRIYLVARSFFIRKLDVCENINAKGTSRLKIFIRRTRDIAPIPWNWKILLVTSRKTSVTSKHYLIRIITEILHFFCCVVSDYRYQHLVITSHGRRICLSLK